MKSEPDAYSIDDLKRDKVHCWDGVRSYQARNSMRDQMHKGDGIIFYHSSAETIGAVGVAKVVSLPYPDHTQFNPKSHYFDAKSKKENPTWIMVDVRFVKKFSQTVTRDAMKREHSLSGMLLWKYNRLSIVELTLKEFDTITELGKKK